MVEEENNEQETQEGEATPNEDEGNEPTASEKIKQLNEDTKRINQAIAENENAKARQKMSGVSEAGQTPVKKSEDEIWAEDAKKRYEGTGLDPTEDNSPITYS